MIDCINMCCAFREFGQNVFSENIYASKTLGVHIKETEKTNTQNKNEFFFQCVGAVLQVLQLLNSLTLST